MSGFSFKLTKTVEKKVLQDSKIRDDSTKDDKEERDIIKDVSGNKITGTIVKKKEEILVIPMIAKNKWKDRGLKTDDDEPPSKEPKVETMPAEKSEKDMSIMELAAKELVAESRKQMEDWSNADNGPEVDQVPLLLANAVPEGFETDENLDVSLRAEQSSLDDYESIPVDKYGLAMLRGMGWKPGEGIGGFKKQVIATIDPVVRPKGLGLGASRPKKQKDQEVKEGEEKLSLKRGAFVLIDSGNKAGLYGEIEGLDEENARLVIKLVLGGEKVSVSENIIKLVTKQEFKEWGKIVNKEKFKKYKADQDSKKGRELSPEQDVMVIDDKLPSRKKEKRRSSSRDSSPEVKRVKVEKRTWVRPDLRVRCIDKKYKGGKYFNEKLIVVDVVTNNSCDCRTEEGKMVQGLRTDKLETVIPRDIGGRVQIIEGKFKNEIAELLDKDKSKCRANVRLVISGKVLLKDYEDICSYTGTTEEYEMD